jgi:nucleoside-diphosphate-sugar epimerase
MKILLTGVTSFSGVHFAYEFLKQGHQVTGFSRNVKNWNLEQIDRIKWIKTEFPQFSIRNINELNTSMKFDLICLHGAFVQDYKSVDFDIQDAVEETNRVTSDVVQLFPEAAILHTGTFSEPNESAGESPRLSFNPYSTSKSLAWNQLVDHYSSSRQLSKYVMPNPFGPLESKRYIDSLLKHWGQGKVPRINFPFHIRDNVPIDLLRRHYVSSAEDFLASAEEKLQIIFRPSLYVESVLSFTQRYIREIQNRTSLKLTYTTDLQAVYTEPIVRVNTQNCLIRVQDWIEEVSWNGTVSNAINRLELYSRNKNSS